MGILVMAILNMMSPYHTYSDTGTYNVTLIVSDSAGCVMPDTSNVTVNVYEINNALVVGDSILCPGTVATLNAYGGSHPLLGPQQILFLVEADSK